MEEKKICKSCDIEKLITDFHLNPKMKSGRANVCKKCVSLGKRITDPNKPSLQAQLKWDRLKEDKSRMSFVTVEDYLLMYEFIRLCGYDTDKDVHQQFLDKWNPHVNGKPMKYKKRYGTGKNMFLPNGERNPDRTTNKKTPPITGEV